VRGRSRVGWVLAVTIAGVISVAAPGGAVDKKGQVTYFSAGITPGSSYVQSITAGPDDNLWFAESGVTDGRIGRITPAGVITEFSAGLTPGSSVGGITAGPDGNLWFTEDAVDADRRAVIGRITPAGVITEFSAGLTPQASLNRITAGSDGNLWFTEFTFEGGGGLDANGFPVSGRAVGKVGRITPAGVVTEFSAGITDETYFITAGCDGRRQHLVHRERVATERAHRTHRPRPVEEATRKARPDAASCVSARSPQLTLGPRTRSVVSGRRAHRATTDVTRPVPRSA